MIANSRRAGDSFEGGTAMSTPELRGFNHPRIRLVLSILQRAAKLADEGKCHRWEFAVELDHLLSSGATVNDLRAMLFEGTIEAAVETTSPRSKSRRFRQAASMAIPPTAIASYFSTKLRRIPSRLSVERQAR
jgi:hypothetical protein